MSKNQKLELTWFGKDDEIKIEPRILIENKELAISIKTKIRKICLFTAIIYWR